VPRPAAARTDEHGRDEVARLQRHVDLRLQMAVGRARAAQIV
jgi:hypothetical protein